MIVNRDHQIENFTPEYYWEVNVVALRKTAELGLES
jgi:DNA topoisomerase IA